MGPVYSEAFDGEHENTDLTVEINSLHFKNDFKKTNSTQPTGEGGGEANVADSFLAKRVRR